MANPFSKILNMKAPKIANFAASKAQSAKTSFKNPSTSINAIKNISIPKTPSINLGKYIKVKIPKATKMAVLKKAVKKNVKF